MRTVIIVLILLLLSFGTSASLIEGQQVWFLDGWQNRAFLKVNRRAGSESAFVEFYSGGLCRQDGSDIVVVDSYGKVVPCRITTIGPGDRYLITYELTGANSYVLYYNNPAPSGISVGDYSRRDGLLLKVFRLVGDKCKDIDQLTTIVNESKTLVGSGYRRRIFDGYNPYGDSDNYLAVYSGYLNIEEEGTYRFATNSNDASFLFIDGKLVASFPGRHFAWAKYGQKNGSMDLRAGIHQISYYHVEFVGHQAAVAGWKRPGAGKFEVIPERAFIPISSSQIVRRESRGGDFYDYTFSYGEVLYPGNIHDTPVIEINFHPYILKEKNIREIQWDFGGEQVVRGKEPSRLFLMTGLCTVKMTVFDKRNVKHFMTHIVPVYPIEGNNTKAPDETASRFDRILAKYDCESLSHEELLTLFHFCVSRDDDIMAVKIGSRLIDLFPNAQPEKKIRFLNRFAEYLEKKPFTNAGLREKICGNLLSLTDEKKTLDNTKLRLANACYEQLNKRDKSKELYNRLIEEGDESIKRAALIGRGNIAIEENEIDRAREYYRRASDLKVRIKRSYMLVNLHSFAIEKHIENDNYYQALSLLEKWEKADPMARLDGYTLISRVRIFRKSGDLQNAIRYSKILVDNLEQTLHTAEAYAVLITLLKKSRRTDEVGEYLHRFREEYPGSRFINKLDGNGSDIVELQPGEER